MPDKKKKKKKTRAQQIEYLVGVHGAASIDITTLPDADTYIEHVIDGPMSDDEYIKRLKIEYGVAS